MRRLEPKEPESMARWKLVQNYKIYRFISICQSVMIVIFVVLFVSHFDMNYYFESDERFVNDEKILNVIFEEKSEKENFEERFHFGPKINPTEKKEIYNTYHDMKNKYQYFINEVYVAKNLSHYGVDLGPAVLAQNTRKAKYLIFGYEDKIYIDYDEVSNEYTRSFREVLCHEILHSALRRDSGPVHNVVNDLGKEGVCY